MSDVLVRQPLLKFNVLADQADKDEQQVDSLTQQSRQLGLRSSILYSIKAEEIQVICIKDLLTGLIDESIMSEVIIYKTKDGHIELKVNLSEETVWLTQKQLSDLFDKNIRTISEHINNIFEENELDEKSVVRNFRITAADGKSYDTKHYNLDVIISTGYRVHSKRGTEFRQ